MTRSPHHPHHVDTAPHTALDQLTEHLRTRLSEPLPGPSAQRAMAARPHIPGWSPDLSPPSARRAAGLVLVYAGATEPCIALTRRRDDLPHHPSQISVPGGSLAEGETALDAALRETREEIGISSVDILGALSPVWIPVSNFVLSPFVGVLRGSPGFAPDPREVAAMVEFPVSWLGEPHRIRWGTRQRADGVVDYPYYALGDLHVWGATAMILAEFAHVLRLAPPLEP